MPTRTPWCLVVLVLALGSCNDPDPQRLSPGVTLPPADVSSVTFAPSRDDGRTPRAVRFTIELGQPAEADAARAGRIVLVAGGADPAEVLAIAKSRAPASLRARQVAIAAWGDPPNAPQRLYAQPSIALPVGRATLVVLIDRRPPFSLSVSIASRCAVRSACAGHAPDAS